MNGLASGVGPPRVMWLPPPDPSCRPSSMYFSACSPTWSAASKTCSICSAQARPLRVGWTFTSRTPGSGVTEKRITSGVHGGG